jgi:metal-responsive CopG/Arc/MetJ family transcriptional regulator
VEREMTDTTSHASNDRLVVSTDVPRAVLEEIDRLAERELISRRAWIRRALLNLTREAAAA